MALTRKLLKSFGLEESVIDSIVEAHAETVDGLKTERDEAKKTAESAQAVTKERDDLKKQLDELQKANGDAAKIQKDFDDYKAGIAAEKAAAAKKTALRTLLRDQVGIKRESALDLIMAAEKLDGYELDDKNQLKDADGIVKAMKEKHAEWIGETKIEGVKPLTPPAGGGGTKMTKDEIAKITDPAKMRAAIAENIELFK